MAVSSGDITFHVSVLLRPCKAIKFNWTLQRCRHFTQAEIATQKNKGLTPIKKVSYNLPKPDDLLSVTFTTRVNEMWQHVVFQPEVKLFGPHDTSRLPESDLPHVSSHGKPNSLSWLVNTLTCQASNWYFLISWNVFSDLPVKQGILFSEDESQMDVDLKNIKHLIAPAKITMFEVVDYFS